MKMINRYLLAAAIVLCGVPAKAQDLTMLEDRFGLPVFQTGPNDKALWWTWRILTKHKQIGEAIFAKSEECEKYNDLVGDSETKHIWCAANVPPYCEELSKEIDGIDEITSAEVKRIGRAIVTKMGPPKGFECVGIPTAYHGVWCAIGDTPASKYRRCRQLRGEEDLEIRARSTFNGEVVCKPLTVKAKGKSHLVWSRCIFIVGSSREDFGPTKSELRLTDGGRRLSDAQPADAEVPAQYRGLWCDGSKGYYYYRCRKATSEGYQHIRRDRIKLSEEGDCRITAVMPTGKGHQLRVDCPPGVLSDPPEHVNLRLDARGRLHFDWTAKMSKQTAALPSGPNVELKDGYYELSSDDGGNLRSYSEKFKEIEKSGLVVRVTAMCASACTLVLRNPRACAEPNSVFGFHQAKTPTQEISEFNSRLLWEQYPKIVRTKIGQLTPDMAYLKGTYLLPECK